MDKATGESPSDFPPQSPFHVAIRCLCPRCGRGRLFIKYLKMADRCDHCDLDFTKANVGDAAVPFIMLLVGFIGVGLGVWLQFKFDSPFWIQIVVTFPVIIALTLWLLQPSKALFFALEYKQKAGEEGRNTFDAED